MFKPFYNLLYPLTFYEQHSTAIWFYSIIVVIAALGIIPWIIGWVTILT